MKMLVKRISISFAISSFIGLIVNLFIDMGVNTFSNIENFVSIPPAFVELFPTMVMAAYGNVLIYGVIGAVFAAMTFVFELDRIGFLLQYLIYFAATSAVLAFITLCLWKLQNIPMALVSTLIGYGLTFLIMGLVQYKAVKRDICEINEFAALN